MLSRKERLLPFARSLLEKLKIRGNHDDSVCEAVFYVEARQVGARLGLGRRFWHFYVAYFL